MESESLLHYKRTKREQRPRRERRPKERLRTERNGQIKRVVNQSTRCLADIHWEKRTVRSGKKYFAIGVSIEFY